MQVEALLLNQLAHFVRVEAILSEHVVSAIGNLRCHLLPHFDKVRARDDTKVDALSTHLLQG